MNWLGVVIIYILLFAFTTYVTYKKAGVWAKDSGEGISGIILKSFVLWIYLAGFVGILISCITIQGNSSFFITEGRSLQMRLETFTSSMISFILHQH